MLYKGKISIKLTYRLLCGKLRRNNRGKSQTVQRYMGNLKNLEKTWGNSDITGVTISFQNFNKAIGLHISPQVSSLGLSWLRKES